MNLNRRSLGYILKVKIEQRTMHATLVFLHNFISPYNGSKKYIKNNYNKWTNKNKETISFCSAKFNLSIRNLSSLHISGLASVLTFPSVFPCIKFHCWFLWLIISVSYSQKFNVFFLFKSQCVWTLTLSVIGWVTEWNARQKANYPLASRPSQNPQLKERALNSRSHTLQPCS